MRVGLVMMVAALLVACGSSEGERDAASGQGAAAPVAAAAVSDAVSAVLQSPGKPVARLQFELDSKPAVGKQFRLKLIATADEVVPVLQLTVESQQLGLEPASAVLALETAGVGATHELAVTPPKEGLAELVVRLRTGPDGPESVYAVPVLVAASGTG